MANTIKDCEGNVIREGGYMQDRTHGDKFIVYVAEIKDKVVTFTWIKPSRDDCMHDRNEQFTLTEADIQNSRWTRRC